MRRKSFFRNIKVDYLTKEFHRYPPQTDVRLKKTTPYCQQPNGLAERINRCILEKAVCIFTVSIL